MSRRLETMPDGTMVSVPSNISREKLEEVRAKYPAKKATRVDARAAKRAEQGINTKPTSQRAAIDARKARLEQDQGFNARNVLGLLNPASMAITANKMTGGNLFGGTTFNFDDEIAGAGAALGGIPDAIRQGSFDPIKEKYRVEQRARDEVKEDFARDNPGTALGAQMVGGAVVPFGGTGKTLYKGAQALRGAGATRAASAVGRTAARMRRSGPITRGVTTGAGVGALNAAGESDDLASMPGDAVQGGVAGAMFGGTFGAAVRGGGAVARTIKDRRTVAQGGSEATRARAYKRVGSLIDNIRGKDDKPIGADAVARNIRSANRTGADTRLMDQAPGLRAEAATLGRDTNLPNSNRLQDLAEDRILKRQGKFNEQVSKRASTRGVDARDLRQSVDDARGIQGDFDYRDGGPIDATVQWTPNLNSFFEEAGPTTNSAMRKAYDIMLDERRDPTIQIMGENAGTFTAIPTFRTLDYLKRGYDELIETAMKKSRSEARRISNELTGLKEMLIEQNPEYGKILATQRDAFQRMQAVEEGQRVFQGMKNKPREMLRELNKLDGTKKDDARIGIIDQLLNLDIKADPIAAVRGYMRNAPQRKILEFAFGGKKELSSFEKYLENEVKATATDQLVSVGRNSATQTLRQAGMSQDEALAEIGGGTLRGFGFGGGVGAVANAVAGVRKVANQINPEVQNEIARILMSKGEDLEEGLAAAARFFALRTARDRSASAITARTVATPVGAALGD